MKKGRHVHVGSAARQLVEGVDRHGELARARAVAVWREVAGPEVSRHAAGYSMRGSELVVFVDTAVWAAELSALSEQYRTAVNQHLGQELVGSMRFTVSRTGRRKGDPIVDDEEVDAPQLVKPVPLDEAEREHLEGIAGSIHDERLREAVKAAARSHLEWRKGERKKGS